MSEQSELPKLRLLLVADQTELIDWFMDDVGALPNGEEEGGHSFMLSNHLLHIQTLSAPPENAKALAPTIDLMVGLMRFVDVISLQNMSQILNALPSDWRIPAGFFIYRNEGETDFKMSCPYCGQKLWVRDADQDKRGRCPNCKKGFTLPAQEEHLNQSLRLRESILVRRIEKGTPTSISGPLKALIRMQAGGVRLKEASGRIFGESGETMNVNLETGPID
ncbi:MAG: hypothetical protein JJU29_16360 [Verrucomicrobia bacterium]|nr:hypothetical protein [Verrucomicrobiota bacterium]MCH8513627.1 hypothetical protein [Kiritimatiellia bacterium]